MANKPNIRFKGFTDDWEQRKLGDILERRIEQRRQSADYPRLAFASGQGVIPLSERKTNNREQLTKDEFTKKYLVTEMNDIVYNPANVKYGAIDRNKFGRGLISPIYVTFTTREDAGFIERIVTSHEFQQKALRFEEGTVTKRQSVNPEDFVMLDILLASNKSEQKKVSVFFDTLDHLITLHQRKCDETKKLKKFMLQKMFPKNGEKNPEIRFAGFTDDWEQRKVEDIMSCVTDYVAAGSFADIKNNVTYLTEPDYAQLVRTVDLKKKFANTDYVFVDKNAFDYLWRVNLNEDCIVLPNIGANIGEVYYVEPSELPQENNVLGPNAILLKTEEEKYFIFTSLTTDDFQRQLFENVGSSGQPKFNKTELKNISLWLPSVEEQKKIGDTLRNLDHLITLHQRKCDKLKLIKKFMLQNMFPKKG